MSDYKIILADDHSIVRSGVKTLIEKEPKMHVVGEAANGHELMKVLKSTKCQMVILDLTMPQMDGMVAIKKIRTQYPDIKILILTMQKDYEHFKHAISNGACGYVVKDDASDELIEAIKSVHKGKQYVSPSVSKVLTDHLIRSLDDSETPSLEILTKRERQVLTLIVNGMANKNIANQLKISIRTVEHHRFNLSEKLGVKTTAGLVKFALSKGLV